MGDLWAVGGWLSGLEDELCKKKKKTLWGKI